MRQIGGGPNLKIDSLYAYIASDEEGEGIMGASMVVDGQSMMMPLVGADLARIKSLYPIAEEIARKGGKSFRVYRFDNKVDVTEIVKL